MKVLLLLACVTVVTLASEENLSSMTVEERLARLEGINRDLLRQVSLQQFYTEELMRTELNSGISNAPLRETGPKNYQSNAHIPDSYMGMHDHPELERTVGIGELDVVMNGFHFRTKHNDFDLVMPSNTTEEYHATEDIPFPPVPDSVLKAYSMEAKMGRMRDYFKMFAEQSKENRAEIAKYFLPNLCYMEGAWTNTSDDRLDEPFQNGRHRLDNKNARKLLKKVQAQVYKGSHSGEGRVAFLPESLMRVDENDEIIIAQFQYRVLCHPLKGDLPTTLFQPVEDLAYRLPREMTREEALKHPNQRFVLNEKKFDHSMDGRSILDQLMTQIPGKNNYPGYLEDHTLSGIVLSMGKGYSPMNTGYYHRYYRTDGKGAMGTKTAFRGYNDAHNWVAQTNHDKVIRLKAGECEGRDVSANCTTHAAYTFAIPLEIIYTTPLARWNPYQVPEKDERQKLPVPEWHVGEGTDAEVEKYYPNRVHQPARVPVNDVTDKGKRNGKQSSTKAFNGVDATHFYKTPMEFYTPGPDLRPVTVKDSHGQLRQLVSSGIRTFTPHIPGVGRVRLRYPIAPLSEDGRPASKELNALKEMTLKSRSYIDLYEEEPCTDGNRTSRVLMLEFQMRVTHQDPPGEHTHTFQLPETEYLNLQRSRGGTTTVITSMDQGHTHELEIAYNKKKDLLMYTKCDGEKRCIDGHGTRITSLFDADE